MPLDPQDAYLISFLDELPLWSAPFGLKLIDRIIPQKNLKVLDIGFGTGFPLLELAMRLGNTCRLYGIDPSEAACERTREKIKIYGIKNVDLLELLPNHDQADRLYPIPDDHLDLIVSNNGLNNVQDLTAVVKECYRILKPGGRLIFTMNLDSTMLDFYHVMEPILFTHGLFSSIEAMKRHIYEKRKPLDEIRYMLTESGFRNIEMEEDSFNYRFNDGTTLFNHFFIRLAFLDSWHQIVPEESRQEIFDEIELNINRIAFEKGTFNLKVPFALIQANK